MHITFGNNVNIGLPPQNGTVAVGELVDSDIPCEGNYVTMHGLKTTACNGLAGRVVGFHPGSGRYAIELVWDGRTLLLKRENFEVHYARDDAHGPQEAAFSSGSSDGHRGYSEYGSDAGSEQDNEEARADWDECLQATFPSDT